MTVPQSRFEFDVQTDTAFAAYHAENPRVYDVLRRFALQAKRLGRKRLSINMLFERVRWYTDVEGMNDTFKVNNNWRAYYARLLMKQEPDLAGFFETRTSRADDEV